MDLSFGEALLVFGGLLFLAASLSGVMGGTVLSSTVLSVSVGVGLAASGVVEVDRGSDVVKDLVTIALVLTLFSDGLFAERELLARHWSTVARALVLAMPITLCLLALAAHVLFGQLDWAAAFLLAAVLTPTDPVVTSAVVTSRSVPAKIRHTLNLESGLNDGLALPFVLFFLILSQPGGDAGTEGVKLLGEAAFGAVLGIALGWAGGKLEKRLPAGGLSERYIGIYAIGLGLIAYGLAEVTFGNGLIAAFVCGVALGAGAGAVHESFVEFAENVSTIAQVLTFFVFGALIVGTGYDGSVPALIAFILFALLVARPAAIGIAFIREQLPGSQKAFIAWFGPKGVASMLFALYVLDSEVPDRPIVFSVAAFVILASVTAHGLTDTVGSRWIGERLKRDTP